MAEEKETLHFGAIAMKLGIEPRYADPLSLVHFDAHTDTYPGTGRDLYNTATTFTRELKQELVVTPAAPILDGASFVTVVDYHGEPIKKTTTNDKGRYSIPFNDGGGRYRVTVRAIGKTPFIQNVSRLLHTPLMSLTNAISGIIIVGAMLRGYRQA